MLSNVSQICRNVSQPRGGYIKPGEFEMIVLNNQTILNENENIAPGLIGTTVDYMTRYRMGIPLVKAFQTSVQGAINIGKEAFYLSANLGREIRGLDDNSIINACRLAVFDTAFRNPRFAGAMPSINLINPNPETINNIRIMINRSEEFWHQYGPIVETGFTFESAEQKKNGSRDDSSLEAFISGGYTYTVANGEGDYLTKDTIWDFKVSKRGPKSSDTLQILIYWIMGQHSGQDIYEGINRIGIYNPRLNTAYLMNTDSISDDIIRTVEKEIIGYSN